MSSITITVVCVCLILWGVIMATILTTTLRVFFLLFGVVASIGVWVGLQHLCGDLLGVLLIEYNQEKVQFIALLAALGVMALFFICSLMYALIAPKKNSVASFRGILINVVMAIGTLWVISVGFFYGGSLAKINYYQHVADEHMKVKTTPKANQLVRWNEQMRQSDFGKIFLEFNPIDNIALTNLACIVSYGCTQDEARYNLFYKTIRKDYPIPESSRLLALFEDKEMRRIVSEGKLAELMNHERLHEFIYSHAPTERAQAMGEQVRTTEDVLKQIALIPIQ